jgi:hypothetical protein
MYEIVQALGSVLLLALVGAVAWRLFRRRGRAGPGTIGTMHDMLSEDRRKAMELVVEERAEERDPETADGNLPDLEEPRR